MTAPVLRDMADEELGLIAGIDRMEHVDAFYRQTGQKIVLEDIKPFDGGWVDLPDTIAFCHGHMCRGARAIGAFVGDTLVGIAMVTPRIAPDMAQLSFLHITAAWRRKGLATRLFAEVKAEAVRGGHKKLYVTATPTRSAVGFYLNAGFTPTADIIPELFALEPEDIHMTLEL